MFAISLYFTEPEPIALRHRGPATEALSSAEEAERPAEPIPWSLLTGQRVIIETQAGLRAEGKLLGLDADQAVLTSGDGRIVSVAVSDVATVRIADEPVAPVAAPEPALGSAGLDRGPASAEEEDDDEDDDDRVTRAVRLEQRITAARRGAIAGGVLGSFSALSSIIAEGFNISAWSLSEERCGYDDITEAYVCGWTDDGWSYGIGPSATAAFAFHLAAGPSVLNPTRRLRNELDYRKGRGRQIAGWVLWGVGIGSLVADQAVSWRQWGGDYSYVCEESYGTYGSSDCFGVTRSRGAPPPFYLISAGLTLSSTILGIIDAKDVIRHAETSGGRRRRGATRDEASVSMFPIRLEGGGGLGLNGRF